MSYILHEEKCQWPLPGIYLGIFSIDKYGMVMLFSTVWEPPTPIFILTVIRNPLSAVNNNKIEL